MSVDGMELRAKMLQRCQRRFAEVEIPTLGTVRIQSLTERERAQCEVYAREDLTHLRAWLIAYAVVDAEGNRLFGDAEISMVMDMDSSVTVELAGAVEDHVEAGAIEDPVKN